VIGLLLAVAALGGTNVGVAEREWHVDAYAAAVRRGPVSFNVHNYGEDPHDLQVRGPHGFRSRAAAQIAPGANRTLTVLLRKPGVYRLVCTLPGHAARGMRSTIRVR
jgi:uncharacterized cupredoxin-like copper-binding protein